MGKWGFFITFEGIEGSGKSTLANMLYEKLKVYDFPVVFTREPGGTDVGEKIREIILNKNFDIDPYSELFLFLVARRENVKRIITPALREGKIVICDRFDDSTFAYQGFGRNIPLRFITRVNKLITEEIKPNLTFLIDVPVNIGFSRIKREDRIEIEKTDFHERVRKGFLTIAKRAKKRVIVLNGEDNLERNIEICEEITFRRLLEKGKFVKKIKEIKGEK
ncbi:MAG: dTMP kinase [candidate division WOR-3 bacterium]